MHRIRFALFVAIALIPATTAVAQPCLLNCPSATPSPTTPEPTPTAPPEESSDPTGPVPSDDPGLGLPTPPPTLTPSPDPSVPPTPSPAVDADLPEGLEEAVEELVVPVFSRTPPRNTIELVELLQPLTELGLPLEQVLIEGMGRFPVAGLTFYSDDWKHPRYNPTPHLHDGLDLFADFGTPIRAPDRGRITRLSTGGAGGIGLWMRGQDGTDYYFAHLESRAQDIEVGRQVSVGTVLGYVGDTGNASGGSPHLHMEIHRGGPIPPKPIVDGWLDQAIELAPGWVEARMAEVEGARELIDTEAGASRTTDLEANMVLTLLDPVGGSVGLLPRLELSSPQRPAVSDRLMDELIRSRLHGFLFAPGASGPH